ncbi:unnamed protein product [Adineta ricciae]|uniref:G domain-containing protein n=1 Tax=Adineta ricciae TaxID=249248 RepID=A0A814I1G2_ADIRI|nr:unnamed protein product [Adineta ricciae]CAF1339398.1 unnamed protein product [Adineta ricciae]
MTIKRFIVLGDAGAGKSSLINFLFNYLNGTTNADQVFIARSKIKTVIPCANWLDCLDEKYTNNMSESNINDQTQSQTQYCTTYTIFRGPNKLLEVIDTPGFNDTHGDDIDTKNLNMIEKELKKIPFLNGIIMVVNGSSPRLGLSFKNFLHMLHQIWPNDLMNNCVAVLTNCDQLSVNLDPAVLERDLNVNGSKTFHLQNSLFRWDRKLEPMKKVARFRQDFEDNLVTIESLLDKLEEFEDVSTKSFSVGAIKIALIENCIQQSISNMIELLEKYKQQKLAEAGIEGAQNTMENNRQWEKQHEIHAIRWVENPVGRSSSSKHSQHQQPHTHFYNGQYTIDPHDHQSNRPRPQTANNRPTRLSSDPGMGTVVGESRDNKTTLYTAPATNQHPKAEGSQQEKASGALQDEEDLVRSKLAEEIGGSQHGMRANESHTEMGFRGSNCGPKGSIPQHRRGTGGSYYAQNDGRISNDAYVDTRNKNENRWGDAHSRTPSSGNHYGFSNSEDNRSSSSRTPVYQQQQTKIQVTLPDNEARAQHTYAERQESSLKRRAQYLHDEKESLKGSLRSQLDHLQKQVAELRSINKKYNILEKNHDLLNSFKDISKYMGDDPYMLQYYNETVAILSNT